MGGLGRGAGSNYPPPCDTLAMWEACVAQHDGAPAWRPTRFRDLFWDTSRGQTLWGDLLYIGSWWGLVTLLEAWDHDPLTASAVLAHGLQMSCIAGLFWFLSRQSWAQQPWIQAYVAFNPRRTFLLMLVSAALVAVAALLWL